MLSTSTWQVSQFKLSQSWSEDGIFYSDIMAGMVLMEPTDLYNLLNEKTLYPALSDPNYLLLLDAREKEDYEESHVITAKKAPKNENGEYVVPYDAELECKHLVIVYDGNTQTLKEDSPSLACGKVMWEMGSRNEVHILRGGYEDFSALYPFLRTQKIIYMPRELDEIKTYPTEIMPAFLYLGNWQQGNAAYIQKDLKIRAHVNCCTEPETFFKEEGPFLHQVPIEDSTEADLHSKLVSTCAFIDTHNSRNHCVLIFSKLGISRSAAVACAYLMHHYKWNLKEAYDHMVKCCPAIRPNRGFVVQLSQFEEDLFGQKLTDTADPRF